MNERRIGRFTVPDHMLRQSINDGSAAHLFAGAVPLDVQRDWMQQTTTYICWHPEFRVIPEGEMAPTYIAVFRKDDTGGITHAWRETAYA